MTTSSLAQVAKLVDAGDSKSPAARCVGSSPTLGTTLKKQPYFRAVFLRLLPSTNDNQEAHHSRLIDRFP